MNEVGVDKKPFFNKDVTYIIKGIALLMMFVHHFLTFPSWWPDNSNFLLTNFYSFLNKPLNICVSIFCFITGYFYFFNKNKYFKNSIHKIIKIYIDYWLVLIPLFLIALIFLKYKPLIINSILELLAIKNEIMIFGWYVSFYAFVMLFLPIYSNFLSINFILDITNCYLIFPIIIKFIKHFVENPTLYNYLSNLYSWLPYVIVGYIFGKYDVFYHIEKLIEHVFNIINKNLTFTHSAIVILIPLFRNIPKLYIYIYIYSGIINLKIDLDIVLFPLFIYYLVSLIKTISAKYKLSIIMKIGNVSSYMWFISCAFFGTCSTIFKPILYMVNCPFIIVVIGTLLCYTAALIIESIRNKLFTTKKIKRNIF